MKKHRDQADIPVDIAEKRARMNWIENHPAWDILTPYGRMSRVSECINVQWAYVDPVTRRIEDDESRNTQFEVWIEAGPMHDLEQDCAEGHGAAPVEGWNWGNRWCSGHDHDLDCGAPDLETAYLLLASLVDLFYDPETGKARPGRPRRCEGSFEGEIRSENYRTGCSDAGDGFCTRCGFRVED